MMPYVNCNNILFPSAAIIQFQVTSLFLFSLYFTEEESIGIMKILDFRFLTDLHVLGCPEMISQFLQNVCRSVWLPACL